jgi:hypothetical protein
MSDAQRFLTRLDPRPEAQFAFQTFDDAKRGRSLTRVLLGRLEEVADELASLNRRGAGVFVAPNELRALPRKVENVSRIRAAYLDLDSAPLAPVLSGPIHPHLITNTSPGRWHCVWAAEDLDATGWLVVQRGLWTRYDGDASMDKVAGVIRLPGFYHQKGEPHPVRVTYLSDDPPYPARELLRAFGSETPH